MAETTSWNSEDTNNQGSPQVAAEFVPPPQKTTNKHIRILIIGPSRSGKTYTIDDFCGATREPMTSGPYEATNRIVIHRLTYEERVFELIDTPGFDNINMSDVEAFAEIAEYLLHPKRIQKGITGVIYIHRAGNTFYSRSLLRNFRVLTNIFLGTTGATRLTFLVTQSETQGVDHGRIMDEMRARGSVFGAAFPAGAAIASSPNRAGFAAILRSYLSQKPILLPIQSDEAYKSYPDFVAQVEKELGYHELKSAQLRLNDNELKLRERELHNQELARQRELEEQLRQQLQDLRLHNLSLESRLSLLENTELNQVAQILDNLNRMISNIGRSLSAHITSDYVLATFGKDTSGITALDAVDLPALKTLLGHVDGKSSLIVSSDGQGMPIEEFIDYSIRSLMSHYLVTSIFEPFHPDISPALNQSLLEAYKKLQNQDPQTNTGKWRSETFRSLCDPDNSDTTERDGELHLNRFIDDRLKPLMRHLLGFGPVLQQEHRALLRRIVSIALDWNSGLKGSDLVIDDFVQTAFRHPCPLNLELMEDFKAKPGSHGSAHVLGTLTLGLLSRVAVGGGNPVEQKTIRKALVITSKVYN